LAADERDLIRLMLFELEFDLVKHDL